MSHNQTEGGGATPHPNASRPYGSGVKTVVMRVPAGYQSYVRWCILKLPSVMDKYHQQEGLTRSWDKARQLRRELLNSQQQFIEADVSENFTVEYRGFSYVQLTDCEARETHF